MKKLIYFTIILVLFSIIMAVVVSLQLKNGLTNINFDTNADVNSADSAYYEYVEYDESYGEICPIGVKFLGKKEAPTIDCVCSAGYEFDHQIIGYEQCYGPGTECPIMGSTCVKEAE